MSGMPLVIHGSVGPATGNIEHPGEVRVLGNVVQGHRITAAGDVLVSGHVTEASVSSDGNLVVNGLCSGPDCELDAVGNVVVRQAVDTKIVAGQSVEFHVSAERCSITAGRSVILRKHPGLLRGGEVRAAESVSAIRIDAAAGNDPVILVGVLPFPDRLADLRDRLTFVRDRLEALRAANGSNAAAYRRRLSDLAMFQSLHDSLVRRLNQASSAGENPGPAGVKVLGPGPVQARLLFGPDRRELSNPVLSLSGRFEVRLHKGELMFRRLEDSAHGI